MPNSAKLASGHIELTVKYGSAMSKIAEDFTGMKKSADRAGTDSGKALKGSFEAALAQGGNSNAVSKLFGKIRSEAQKSGHVAGYAAGRALGAGLTLGVGASAAAATAALGGIGVALTKGFSRLRKIDDAKFKLAALGNSAADVRKIMSSAEKSVKGTAFALDEAASAAAAAVAAGVKPGEDLTKYLTAISDTAAIAGVSFEEMASIFNKVQANGKAYTDDLQMLQDRGVPVMEYLRKQYAVTADEFQKMVEDGKVSAADFASALQANLGGAAQEMGQSLSGSISNFEAALSRAGAMVLQPIFGNAAVGIGNLTSALDGFGKWLENNQDKVVDFWVVVGHGAIIAAEQAILAVSDISEAIADFVAPIGDVLGAVNKFQAWQADIRGDHDTANELREQAESYFSWGESLHAVSDRLQTLAESSDEWHDRLTRWGDATKNNAALMKALGDSFVEVNDKGHIKLTDNTPEVVERLQELGITVENLPDGEVILTPNTPEAQQIVNDFIKSNNPTAPLSAPLNVDTAPAEQKMRSFIDEWKDYLSGGGVGGSAGGNPLTIPLGPGAGAGAPLPPGFIGPGLPGMPGLPAGGGGRSLNMPGAADAWLNAHRAGTYGLPSGTNTGGYGTGTGATFPAWVMQVAQTFGIKPSTYAGHQESDRNEPGYAANPNHENRGIDWTGPVANLQKFADYLAGMPQALEQVIWENPYTHQKTGIGGGQINPGYYPQSTYDEHGGNDPGNIHVHTRQSMPIPLPFMKYDSGGQLPPGVTLVNNETGTDEFVLTGDQAAPLLNGDPNTVQHGLAAGAPPGPPADQIKGGDGADLVSALSAGDRTQGYIPAGAGNSSVAGTSFLSGLYGMGAEVINGVIDQGAALASTAATAAIAAGTMGAGAAGAPAAGAAAQFAIGIGTQAAKRGVQYGAQMLGIGTDALLEQLSPFGMPRWLTTDVTGFMPQQGIMQAATTSIEKAFQQGNQPPQGPGTDPVSGMPGQPHGMPGQPGTSPLGPPPGPPQPDPGAPQQPPTPPPGMPQQPQDLLSYFGIPAVYDEGGWLEPGGIAINKTKTVEPMAVFNDSQWDTMASIANAPIAAPDPKAMGGAGDDFSVHIHSVTVKDVAELERQMKDRQTLQTMRYRGRPSSG